MKQVHYEETGEEKAARLGRNVKMLPGARCGHGSPAHHLRENGLLTRDKQKVTCKACRTCLTLRG